MFRDKKENEKIKEGQGIKKAQLNIWPIKALPNYGELSRFDPAPLYALLLPHNTAPLQPPSMGGSRGWDGWARAHPKNWSKEKSNLRIL